MTKQELRLARWQEKSRTLDGRGGGVHESHGDGGGNEGGGYVQRGRKDIQSGKPEKLKKFQKQQNQHQNQNANNNSATLGFGGVSAASATEKTHMKNKGTIVAGSLQGSGKKIKFTD